MTKRRLIKSDEQMLYSSFWRRYSNWHSGQKAGIRRRVHKRERREANTGIRTAPEDC